MTGKLGKNNIIANHLSQTKVWCTQWEGSTYKNQGFDTTRLLFYWVFNQNNIVLMFKCSKYLDWSNCANCWCWSWIRFQEQWLRVRRQNHWRQKPIVIKYNMTINGWICAKLIVQSYKHRYIDSEWFQCCLHRFEISTTLKTTKNQEPNPPVEPEDQKCQLWPPQRVPSTQFFSTKVYIHYTSYWGIDEWI